MTINPEIYRILDEFNLGHTNSIAVLLFKYFELKPTFDYERIEKVLDRTGIYEMDQFNSFQWRVPLFEGQDVSSPWDWVKKEYVLLFKNANPAKAGNANDCVRRLKALFQRDPSIRKEDILGAAELYIRNTDPTYIRLSHYFISKGKGAEKTEDVLTWVEKYRELQSVPTGRDKNNINAMKKFLLLTVVTLLISCNSTEKGYLIVHSVEKLSAAELTNYEYRILFKNGTSFYTNVNYKVGDTLQ